MKDEHARLKEEVGKAKEEEAKTDRMLAQQNTMRNKLSAAEGLRGSLPDFARSRQASGAGRTNSSF